jgi:hypothetical protein
MGPLCWHDVCVTLASTAVIVTALKRPDYLRQTLTSWQQARGISDVRSFTLALGRDPDSLMSQAIVFGEFIDAAGLKGRARVKMDSDAAARSRGMHRAIGEAGNHVFADPAVEFAVFSEEDVIVSSDVLEYMAWARETFAGDERVLCACAHDVGGSGWNEPGIGLLRADADQEAVQLLPEFSPWAWGTWRDRWERTLEPGWDWECSKGPRPDQHGYDWTIFHTIQREGYVCAVPEASRSQNIGEWGGWAASPADFPNTQAASFRAERSPVTYRLAEAEQTAA